jgi:predicted nucleotidyltransferase
VDDLEFQRWLADELASLPGVDAVSLGGSRAAGTNAADSDWDYAIYYRRAFDPEALRARGWPGQVSSIGGWGGGVMNGGAWLTVEGRRVDVHYRDLGEVEHWCAEARAGRFAKELLRFYVAGIPTYVVMAELATHLVLAGDLPRPAYPAALAREASRRWHDDALASLTYGETTLRRRSDPAVALANASRGLIEAAHGRMARRRKWVLNEKGLVSRAGLADAAESLLSATDSRGLLDAVLTVRAAVAGGT